MHRVLQKIKTKSLQEAKMQRFAKVEEATKNVKEAEMQILTKVEETMQTRTKVD